MNVRLHVSSVSTMGKLRGVNHIQGTYYKGLPMIKTACLKGVIDKQAYKGIEGLLEGIFQHKHIPK